MTHIKYVCGRYVEKESILCLGHLEPHIRYEELIFHSQQSRWNIKATFRSGAIKQQFTKAASHDTCILVREPIKKRLERRQEYQNIIEYINFHGLLVIPDAVTEIDLVLESPKFESPICNPDKLHLVEDIPTGDKLCPACFQCIWRERYKFWLNWG